MNQLLHSGQWATLSAYKKPSSKLSNLSANITSVLMALMDLDPQFQPQVQVIDILIEI